MDQIISFFVAGTTLLLAFLIFANINEVNSKFTRWFGSFIFCIFILQLNDLLEKTEILKTRTALNDFLGLTDFIVGPIFYFSVIYFIKPNRKWKRNDNLHFAFAFIMLLLLSLSLLIEINSPTTADKKNSIVIIAFFNFAFCVQVISYCIMAYKEIAIYQKNLLLYASNVDAINLKWLKQIAACVTILACLWLIDIVFKLAKTNIFFDNFASTIYLFGIFYIAYFSLKQKDYLQLNTLEKEEIETIIIETSNADTNQKKIIPDDDLIKMKTLLIELMENKKPFLDPELSVLKLSAQLDISSHHLSYIINKGCNENFYQFINRYRIEEAKKMIQNPNMDHLTLMGIGFEVGFNSKTVFNTTFKKSTNQTPSEFKKSFLASV